ncbi:hypothetical protein Q4E40_17975 [Pontibacter sp. BT731]|uniref:DUF6929 family protein n=1 Tax=Pontibacter coccineus TaxID=3063328 RepID=UPI0026E219B3|nr:hypothetical protein [Pontibacter sp. BT731]MDO6392029.1 hypothetical protein [Pontibacter sp. BT731]
MNRFFGFLYLAFFSMSSTSCQQSGVLMTNDAAIPELTMKAVITQTLHYDNLPSASGLEMLGDHYYAVGDDSPYLYRLDKNFRMESQEAIFDTTGFGNGRIPKDEKVDLEGITLLQHQGKPYLLMMGSGSAPARRKAYLYNICGDDICREGAGVHGAKTVDLDKLYQQLEQEADTLGGSLLNIEGVAAGHGKLYLLQRAIGTGQNVLISYRLSEFIPFLLGETSAQLPQPELAYFRLPGLKNLQAGFSGAYVHDDKLFFTASLEDTSDAYADGEVLGSYIGYIPFSWVGKQDTLQIPTTQILQADGNPYTGKAESLVVQKREGKGKYKLVVVSDDDKGGSELLEVLLSVE